MLPKTTMLLKSCCDACQATSDFSNHEPMSEIVPSPSPTSKQNNRKRQSASKINDDNHWSQDFGGVKSIWGTKINRWGSDVLPAEKNILKL
jgi:hypothetical protein